MPSIQLNRLHSRAVCRAIAERFSAALGTQCNELPPNLLSLMERLKDLSPSFTPAACYGLRVVR